MKYRNFVFECTKKVEPSLKKNKLLSHLALSYEAVQNNKLAEAYSHARKLSGKIFGVFYQGQLIQENPPTIVRLSSGSETETQLLALYDSIKDKSYILNSKGVIEEVNGNISSKNNHVVDKDDHILDCIPLVDQKIIIEEDKEDKNIKILFKTYSNQVVYLGSGIKSPAIKKINEPLPTLLESNQKLSVAVTEKNINSTPEDSITEKWQKDSLQTIKTGKDSSLYKDLSRTQNVSRIGSRGKIESAGIEELKNLDTNEANKAFLEKNFNLSKPDVEKISSLGQTVGNSVIVLARDWLNLSYKDQEVPTSLTRLSEQYDAFTQESLTTYSYETICTYYAWIGENNKVYILNEKGEIEEIADMLQQGKPELLGIDIQGTATLKIGVTLQGEIIKKQCKPIFQFQGKAELDLSHPENPMPEGKFEISITSGTPALKYKGPSQSSIITHNTLEKSSELKNKQDELEETFEEMTSETNNEEKMEVQRLSISQLHATYPKLQFKNATYEDSHIPGNAFDAKGNRSDIIYYDLSRKASDTLPSVLLFEPVTVGKNEEKDACCLEDALETIRKNISSNKILTENFRAVINIAEIVAKGYLYPGHRHYVTLVIDYTKEGMVARVIDAKGAGAALGNMLGYNREMEINKQLTEHANQLKMHLAIKKRKHLNIQSMQDNTRCGYYAGAVTQYLLENDRVDKLTPQDIAANEKSFSDIYASVINDATESVVKGVFKETSKDKTFENEELFFQLALHKANKKEFVKVIEMFNLKPKDAIKALGTEDSVIIAQFLKNTKGLDKSKIGEYLGELGASKDEIEKKKGLKILDMYINTFNFKEKDFVPALREFLDKFQLPGEAQKIDRIVEAFAKQFYEQNKNMAGFQFNNADAAYTLAFSIIMLNTDAHNPSVINKMSKEAFIKNNRDINAGKDFPKEMLNGIYDEIIKNEIKLPGAPSKKEEKKSSGWGFW